MNRTLPACLAVALTCGIPIAALAAESSIPGQVDMTGHWMGMACLAAFVVAYLLVAGEEFLHLRKSVPVMAAAGIIWFIIAVAYARLGNATVAAAAVRH